MRSVRNWPAAVMVAAVVLGAGAARAESGGLTRLDARHYALVKGDRIVIYEIEPARGYQVRLVNTVLLDAEGQVLGQFRPEAPPAVPSASPSPPAPRAPAKPAPPARAQPGPPPRVAPAPVPPEPGRLEARRRLPSARTLARR